MSDQYVWAFSGVYGPNFVRQKVVMGGISWFEQLVERSMVCGW